ncbi:L-aspartate oxidase [hydrothermal vent metagenome]|uniref:L-aspartate oxidase n=1 Tax=hydrothermal vent metagenome TaxID=652676 RepID=A0A3B1CDE4_9ZZZZ
MNNNKTYDFLIVGSGLAGLFAAYQAAKYGSVLIVSKIKENKINSWLAQGGIAVAMGEGDSIASHIVDTLKTGRGICDKDAVKVLVEEGIECVQELIDIGMKFDKKNGKYNFGLEGGHSKRRVIHAHGSSTGEAVTRFLYDKVKEDPNITFLHHTQVLDLVSKESKVIGINTLNMESGEVNSFFSKNTIIATGGYNNIYLRNTNPNAAVGEGISMVLNAGAEIRDMEFTQFHPTAFYSEGGAIFLISEAVRGEGAYLINSKGERFMSNYHEMEELAPRDVVARAIFEEIKKSDKKFIYLDARHLGEALIKDSFSNIYEFALAEGIDMTAEMIPIAPAAHYSIGGIKTDLFGATNVGRLFAIGESASTGVHGANRLASNSLLECLVFGRRAAVKASENIGLGMNIPESDLIEYKISDFSMQHYNITLRKLQKIFTEKVGIVRNEDDLSDALTEIKILYEQLPVMSSDLYFRKESDLLKLAESIVRSALYRKESRGAHQRSDFSEISKKFYGHIVLKNSEIKFEEI